MTAALSSHSDSKTIHSPIHKKSTLAHYYHQKIILTKSSEEIRKFLIFNISIASSYQIQRMTYDQENVGKRGNMHRKAADMAFVCVSVC